MITGRLVFNVLTHRLPVSQRVLNGVSLVLLGLALATAWMALQP